MYQLTVKGKKLTKEKQKELRLSVVSFPLLSLPLPLPLSLSSAHTHTLLISLSFPSLCDCLTMSEAWEEGLYAGGLALYLILALFIYYRTSA